MDKVTIQFEKLKSQGKINIAEKVKMSKVDNFAAIKIIKTIKYNKGMNKLQGDEVNFWLLHEEGHLDNPIKKIHLAYLCSMVIISLLPLILSLKYFIISVNVDTILFLTLSICLFLLILIPLTYVWMKNIQQNREYQADDFACKKIDDPLRIESAFKQARYNSTNEKSPLQKIFAYIISAKYSHPSDEDRINRMKQNHNEKIV